MANHIRYKKLVQNVEIPCKTPSKTPCIFRAKKCVQPRPTHPTCVKNNLFTDFSRLSHHFFHTCLTSVAKPSFPLFHNPYYNNYYIN